jgi:hypothetical protein
MRNPVLIVGVVCLLLVGCARYEYQLVRPPELSRHIGRGSDEVVRLDPLEYRLRSVDNRLVMRIFNLAEDPVEMVGPKCSVVDPDGQSHPLPSLTIPPGAFIKQIFPPPRPRVYDPHYGPTWGVGIGMGMRVDARRDRAAPNAPMRRGEPVYLAVYDDADPRYWDWNGEGEARVTLVYRRGEDEIRHDFLFRRKKM